MLEKGRARGNCEVGVFWVVSKLGYGRVEVCRSTRRKDKQSRGHLEAKER